MTSQHETQGSQAKDSAAPAAGQPTQLGEFAQAVLAVSAARKTAPSTSMHAASAPPTQRQTDDPVGTTQDTGLPSDSPWTVQAADTGVQVKPAPTLLEPPPVSRQHSAQVVPPKPRALTQSKLSFGPPGLKSTARQQPAPSSTAAAAAATTQPEAAGAAITTAMHAQESNAGPEAPMQGGVGHSAEVPSELNTATLPQMQTQTQAPAQPATAPDSACLQPQQHDTLVVSDDDLAVAAPKPRRLPAGRVTAHGRVTKARQTTPQLQAQQAAQQAAQPAHPGADHTAPADAMAATLQGGHPATEMLQAPAHTTVEPPTTDQAAAGAADQQGKPAEPHLVSQTKKQGTHSKATTQQTVQPPASSAGAGATAAGADVGEPQKKKRGRPRKSEMPPSNKTAPMKAAPAATAQLDQPQQHHALHNRASAAGAPAANAASAGQKANTAQAALHGSAEAGPQAQQQPGVGQHSCAAEPSGAVTSACDPAHVAASAVQPKMLRSHSAQHDAPKPSSLSSIAAAAAAAGRAAAAAAATGSVSVAQLSEQQSVPQQGQQHGDARAVTQDQGDAVAATKAPSSEPIRQATLSTESQPDLSADPKLPGTSAQADHTDPAILTTASQQPCSTPAGNSSQPHAFFQKRVPGKKTPAATPLGPKSAGSTFLGTPAGLTLGNTPGGIGDTAHDAAGAATTDPPKRKRGRPRKDSYNASIAPPSSTATIPPSVSAAGGKGKRRAASQTPAAAANTPEAPAGNDSVPAKRAARSRLGVCTTPATAPRAERVELTAEQTPGAAQAAAQQQIIDLSVETMTPAPALGTAGAAPGADAAVVDLTTSTGARAAGVETVVLELGDSPAVPAAGGGGHGPGAGPASQGAASGSKGPTPAFFMSVTERRRLQKEQEAKRLREEQEPQLGVEQSQQTPQTQPAAAAAGGSAQAPGPTLPVNPFFHARKRTAGASDPSGVTPPARSAADRPLPPALAPIHVTQRPPDQWPAGAPQGVPHVTLCSTSIGTAQVEDAMPAAPAAAATMRPVTFSLLKSQAPPAVLGPDQSGVVDVLTWLAAEANSADPAASGLKHNAQGHPPDLLAELAAHMATAERGSCTDGQLLDLPNSQEHLATLEAALTELAPALQSATTLLAATAQGAATRSDPIVIDVEGPATAGKQQEPLVPQQTLPWTATFQPLKTSQVCGNSGPVSELKTWLEGWKEAIQSDKQQQRKGSKSGPGSVGTSSKGRRAGKGWLVSDDDSLGAWEDLVDSEDWEGGGGGRGQQVDVCNNAVVLSGPTGCGKSAALAVVSKELGYSVVEVNPGSERGGVALTRMISEATQSRRLQRAAGAASGGAAGASGGPHKVTGGGVAAEKAAPGRKQGKGGKKTVGSKRAAALDSDTSADDASPVKPKPARRPAAGGKRRATANDESDGEQPAPATKAGPAASKRQRVGRNAGAAIPEDDLLLVADTAAGHLAAGGGAAAGAAAGSVGLASLHLVVFEEADLLLEEDKGFIATLANLITDTKCPLVLCINSLDPPPGLAQLHLRTLYFQAPTHDQVLRTACLVCCAAGLRHRVTLQQVQHVLEDVPVGDVRQALNALQFWLTPTASPAVTAATEAPSGGMGHSGQLAATCHPPEWLPASWQTSSHACSLQPTDSPSVATADSLPSSTGDTQFLRSIAAAARHAEWEQYQLACDFARQAHVCLQWVARQQALAQLRPLRGPGRGRGRGRGRRNGGQALTPTPALTDDEDVQVTYLTQEGPAVDQTTEAVATGGADAEAVAALGTSAAGLGGPTQTDGVGTDPDIEGQPAAPGEGQALESDIQCARGRGGVSHSMQAAAEGAEVADRVQDVDMGMACVLADVLVTGEHQEGDPGLSADAGIGDGTATAEEGYGGELVAVIEEPAVGSTVAAPPRDVYQFLADAVATVGPLVLPEPPAHVTAACHCVIAQQRTEDSKECQSLAVVAGLCDLLSACDVLSAPVDPVPPVSGPCAPSHRMTFSCSQPLQPGINVAIACLGAARPFPRGAVQGGLVPRPPRPWLPAAGAPLPVPVGSCLEAGDGGNATAARDDLLLLESLGLDAPEPPTLEPGQKLSTVAQQAAAEVTAPLLSQGVVKDYLCDVLLAGRAGGQAGPQTAGGRAAGQGGVAGLLPWRWGPVPEQLQTVNQSLFCTSLRACVQGHVEEGVDRLSMLTQVCHLEAARVAACQRSLTGRALRAARTQHAFKTMCPALDEDLWPGLSRLGQFGARQHD